MTPRDLPRTLNQRKAKKLLEQEGWVGKAGGKHWKMSKPGHRPITLPHHGNKDYSPWLTHRILKEAGLIGADEEGNR